MTSPGFYDALQVAAYYDMQPDLAAEEHDHAWIDDRVGSGDRRHLRDQLCAVCRERRTVAS